MRAPETTTHVGAAPEGCDEVLHLYDGYDTDIGLLVKWGDIIKLNDGSKTASNWGNEKLKRITKAEKSLRKRYAEILDTPSKMPEGEQYPTVKSASANQMLGVVQQNWKNHYVFPRLEVVDFTDYKEYVDASAVCGIKSGRRLIKGEAVYRALWDIHLGPPLLAGDALNIIVPPNVKVTGNIGDCQLYRWGELALRSQ